jgi:putative ABC transport system permease protein
VIPRAFLGLASLRDGVTIALRTMRANKLRSGLTILGVIIGITTVMVMASIVEGIRSQVLNTLNRASPTVFYVIRFLSETPLNPDQLPREVRIRPPVSQDDARAIARLPDILHAEMWVRVIRGMEYKGIRTQGLWIYGADNHYMDVLGGTLLQGRLFSPTELTGESAVLLEREAAHHLFGRENPLGATVRIGGRPHRVIGVYQEPENIFQPQGFVIGAILPFETLRRGYHYDETSNLFIVVRARDGVSVDQAQDQVTAAVRRERGLRPGAPNTFDIITQGEILETIEQLTGTFLLVMIALSSVALLVGGIGVMAIMMVSVTDRTREIGLRKALGATRREILWQFLVEAATLTFVGGLLGIVFGLGAGELAKALLDLRSGVPLWSAGLACAVSIGIGLVFGLYPANRAARMDPVEALRHE